MTSFQRPTGTAAISDTFAEHVARRSVNPGVDYIPGYGFPVYAPEAGRVVIADGNPDGAGGRVVCIDFDNGYGCDLLHLSAIAVSPGVRVKKGQRVGWVGGSGFGQNRYYGTHLHISLRPNHVHLINSGNLDFEKVYRNQTTTAGSGGVALLINEGDPMTATVPVKYTNTAGKTEWARYRPTAAGGVISTTNSTDTVNRWKREINYPVDAPAITTDAKVYLSEWAARIAADTAALKALLAGELAKIDQDDLDEAAIAQILLDHGIDFPSVQEIVDAVPSAAEVADAVRDEIIAPD